MSRNEAYGFGRSSRSTPNGRAGLVCDHGSSVGSALVLDPAEITPALGRRLARLKREHHYTIVFAVDLVRPSVVCALQRVSLADYVVIAGNRSYRSGHVCGVSLELLTRLSVAAEGMNWRMQAALILALTRPPITPKQVAANAGITRRSLDRNFSQAGLRTLSAFCCTGRLMRLVELCARGYEFREALPLAGVGCRKSLRTSVRSLARLGPREFRALVLSHPDRALTLIMRIGTSADGGVSVAPCVRQ